MLRTLQRFPGQVAWRRLRLEEPSEILTPDGRPTGISLLPVALPGKVPKHLEGEDGLALWLRLAEGVGLDRAFAAAAAAARTRLLGVLAIVYVTLDYYASWPKACMDGWARRYIHVAPSGLVLPSHAAHTL